MEDQILTPHFRLSEFSRSQAADSHGINNSVPEELIPNLKNLCEQVLEPLRQHVGVPVIISSGYRCPALNQAVGGVPNSQHLKGEAADIVLPSTRLVSLSNHNHQPSTLNDWFLWILDNTCFDQLIWEKKGSSRWIHVSCKLDLSQNRQVITRIG